MKKPRKRSFSELLLESKSELLSDRAAMEEIEERLEKKHMEKLRNIRE